LRTHLYLIIIRPVPFSLSHISTLVQRVQNAEQRSRTKRLPQVYELKIYNIEDYKTTTKNTLLNNNGVATDGLKSDGI